MKAIKAISLLCIPVMVLLFSHLQAQLPVLPIAIPPSASSSLTPSNFMPSLSNAWEFTNSSVTTNATVTNWIDEISGKILTNGAAALRPTNSASGVGFSAAASQLLTNIPINLGSNYFVSIVFNVKSDVAGNGVVFVSSNSPNFNNFGIVSDRFASTSDGEIVVRDLNNAASGIGRYATNVFMDMELQMSNAPNQSAGQIWIWTNGIFMGHGNSVPNSGNTMDFMSAIAGAPGGQQPNFATLGGFILAVYLQIYPGGLTFTPSVNASNVHYWVTNYLTHGKSP